MSDVEVIQDDDNVRFVSDEAEFAVYQKIAAEKGVQVQPLEHTADLLPVIGIVFIVIGAIAVISEVDRLYQEHLGGYFLDLRGKDPVTGRDHNIPYPAIYVYKADGTLEIKVSGVKDALSEVIQALQGIATDLGKAGIDAAKALAQQKIGDKGTVETKPAATPVPAAT